MRNPHPLVGKRIRLDGHTDIFSTLQPGTEGTVTLVDSMGTVHVDWDNGSTLGLIYGQDRWTIL